MDYRNPNLYAAILRDLVDDYDDTGCIGCGVVGVETINRACVALGLEELEEPRDD